MQRSRSFQGALQNGLAILAALGLAMVLGIPVYEDYQKVVSMTHRQGPIINPLATLGTYGLGPLSGLMMFVISAPIIITGAPTMLTKLVGVTIGFLTSAALSMVTVLTERGDTLAAIALTGVSLLVLIGVFGQHGRMARSQALATQRLVTESVQIVSAQTHKIRGGRAAPTGESDLSPDRGELTDPTSAFHMSALIDRLVIGVIWQASAHKNPRIFRDLVLEGLEEIRADFANNKVTDPQGTATKAASLYLARLDRYFAATHIDPTWSEILGRTPPPARPPRPGQPPRPKPRRATGGIA
ncbi:MAG: hypothetical protein K9H25_02515 [Rhodospirillum sp.]|nr:hypothetical protein [Rhodospirillum sp.]MCF8488003.1 hypothetical protein [Rhodospirillum sp.]MCF8500472.1 hypothetical protein [Rhodospirillum sp.]